jgi:type IV pilus assembly protein PilC
MVADSEEVVSQRLRAQTLTPVKVKKKPREFNLVIGRGVSDKEIATFTRQFATMIDAGLPLVQCLEILSSQSDNKVFAGVLRDVKVTVEGGKTLSEALQKHPRIFDDLFVNLVAAGEAAGILDTILNRLAVYIEKRLKLLRRVRGAMVYPIAILGVATIVIAVLLSWVIPAFEDMFEDFGSPDALPDLTKLVIVISHGFVDHFFVIGIVVTALVFGFGYVVRTPKGREGYDKFLLGVPFIGPVLRKAAVARFTRTMGTLLSSGVPILEALDIVAKSAGNTVISKGIIFARDKIAEGRTMAQPLAETKVFPPMVVQMIAVGEQTGALDQMLNKIADFYEEEVDVAVAALTSALEPIMMVVIGGIVGFIIVAMYLPIFSLAGNIRAQ